MTYFTMLPSPVGDLLIAANADALTAVYFENPRYGPVSREGWVEKENPVLREAVRQLREYFAARRREFDLPLEPEGTGFQKRVWNELQRIPFGRTISYGTLAASIGQPTASRAVGLANGHNPISIIVPCHRVIGANGSLTGYGGGLDRKRWLLEFEQGGSLRLEALHSDYGTPSERPELPRARRTGA